MWSGRVTEPADSSNEQHQHGNSSNSAEMDEDLPFPFLDPDSGDSDSDSDSDSGDPDGSDEDLEDLLDCDPPDEKSDAKIQGIVHAYLVTIKNQVASAIATGGLPSCYRDGQFWIHPLDPYFAMCKAQKTEGGLNPTTLYHL